MIHYDETDKNRLKHVDDSEQSYDTANNKSMKRLAKKMYNYIKTDDYKEIEWCNDGFIIWQA